MADRPNPLIAAVLKQIPGSASTRAQRISWLRMVAMAMDNVYGVDGSALDIPDFLGSSAPFAEAAAPPAATAAVASATPPRAAVRLVEPPRFFIDHAGAARRAPSMDAIMPEELGGETLFDDRGEFGDLGSILWADGRRGVLGLQLSISATPAARRA